MLVLTRKVGEELIIDGNIRITIAEISNGRVKIGITAPPEIHVVRSELEAQPTVVKIEADADVSKGVDNNYRAWKTVCQSSIQSWSDI